MSDLGILNEKVALVTGASKGIGRASALALAKAGANVALLGRNEDDLSAIAKEIESLGQKSLVLALDLKQKDTPSKAVRQTLDVLGAFHILVNNAGVTRDSLVMRLSDEAWDEVMEVNLKGPFRMIREAVRPMMKQKYGRIINISSVVGLTGNPGQANYAASKAGLIGLTKSVALELASRNITSNAVAPGFIKTNMTAGFTDEMTARFEAQIPLKCLGTPDQIAGTVVFLASEQASYITGQVISVDGGLRMT